MLRLVPNLSRYLLQILGFRVRVLGEKLKMLKMFISRLKQPLIAIPTMTLHEINQYNTMFSGTYHNQGSAWDFQKQIGRNRLKANGLPAKGNEGIKSPNIHGEHTVSGGK